MRLCLTVLLMLLALPSAAVIETYEFSAPELEVRYRSLSQELRCPKCQNQNIADSNAPISKDLRRLLYQQLEAGATDQEILEDMVRRYGEFVRYRPDFDRNTVLLWLAPLLFLALGGALAAVVLRRARGGPTQALDSDERARLDALLADKDRAQ
ncbi:cytochrome c-type biogenesis protein [Pseudohaliea rubra]|uniref:Cytochrome c-type biogenesis protein n=1 Tax=Pseudohaliea rubra DSM 19751 TaxID=1265313 RepID=A0A095VPU6_9GAMM|nr:cytochrome c-type biogenesis protein [Pseudohaliea rubra]KGE03415.1 Cytochrome c heme lyase subunit CcmL [Pseudohaliea rubra DSM 19751]